MRCNTPRMNSWHSWSPNGKWLVFSSKANGPYTQLFLTHVDEHGNDTPAVLLERFIAPDRAANIPEFVRAKPGAIRKIHEQFVDDLSFVRAGSTFIKLSDYVGAERALRKALELNPGYVEAHNDLGFALVQQGKIEEGVAHFNEAIRLNPDHAQAHENLGGVLASQGRLEKAIEQFGEAIRSNPHYAEAHFNLGLALARQGKLEEGVSHLAEAIRLNPDYADGHNNLGWALEKQGKLEEAIAHYARASQINPELSQARLNLQKALQKKMSRQSRQ